jgi:hypothetical protein
MNEGKNDRVEVRHKNREEKSDRSKYKRQGQLTLYNCSSEGVVARKRRAAG